jgi:hypothetical protein
MEQSTLTSEQAEKPVSPTEITFAIIELIQDTTWRYRQFAAVNQTLALFSDAPSPVDFDSAATASVETINYALVALGGIPFDAPDGEERLTGRVVSCGDYLADHDIWPIAVRERGKPARPLGVPTTLFIGSMLTGMQMSSGD